MPLVNLFSQNPAVCSDSLHIRGCSLAAGTPMSKAHSRPQRDSMSPFDQWRISRTCQNIDAPGLGPHTSGEASFLSRGADAGA